MKTLELVRWGESRLKDARVDNARLDADLLLGFVLGWRREGLYVERETELEPVQVAEYRELIRRRAARVPLQYLLRRQEFMGLEFYVDQRVLIPRADSEILVEKLIEQVKKGLVEERGLAAEEEFSRTLKILDVATGSGALALSLAHFLPQAQVVGVDISAQALDVARFNAERLGLMVEWREGDFLEPAAGEKWDWIVTNPPYLSPEAYAACEAEILAEPVLAFLGGEDGLDFYRRLAREGAELLAQDGKMIMEIGWDQAAAVTDILREHGFATEVYQDLAGRDRVVLGWQAAVQPTTPKWQGGIRQKHGNKTNIHKHGIS